MHACMSWHSMAWRCVAWYGTWHGVAWHGVHWACTHACVHACHGTCHGTAWPGMAWHGVAWHGRHACDACHGTAWHGPAWCGLAWHGVACMHACSNCSTSTRDSISPRCICVAIPLPKLVQVWHFGHDLPFFGQACPSPKPVQAPAGPNLAGRGFVPGPVTHPAAYVVLLRLGSPLPRGTAGPGAAVGRVDPSPNQQTQQTIQLLYFQY